jgi:DNA polymerase
MKTQIPFSGGSGRLLDMAFGIAGIRKQDVFITNVVHCHTPENRKSFPHEIANCRTFLLEELEIVGPRVIIPLGEDAVVSILGDDAWPESVGESVSRDSQVIYPMYHPSYVLRNGPNHVSRYVAYLANILRRELVTRSAGERHCIQ